MKRKSLFAIVLVMVIFAVLITGCTSQVDWRNPTAASTVRAMPTYEKLEQNVISNIDNMGSFRRSEFQSLKSAFGDSYSLIFYNDFFFEEHNLITVKFDDIKSSSFYISSVENDGGNYTVNLLRQKVDNIQDKSTFCLFLETDKESHADNVVLNITDMPGDIPPSVTYTGVKDNIHKLESRRVSDNKSLNEYVDAKSNIAIGKYVDSYDDEFFATNDLVVTKVLVRQNSSLRAVIKDNILYIDAYATEHYLPSINDLKDSSFRVIFTAQKKSDELNSVLLTKHLEADLGVAEDITTMTTIIE